MSQDLNGSRTGARHQMKTLINTLNTSETAAKVAAGIVNFAMIVSGAVFIAYVVYSAGSALNYW